MKREVLQCFEGSLIRCRREMVLATHLIANRDLLKLWKLPVEYGGEEGERICCSVEGAPSEHHLADVVA